MLFDNYFAIRRVQNPSDFRNLERVRVEGAEGFKVEESGKWKGEKMRFQKL